MDSKSEQYLGAYGEHSKVLRTWLVAYGIGAPVLLVTNDAISKVIKASGDGKLIAIFFLSGVALQVVLSALNKASMWGLYYGEENPSLKTHGLYKLAFGFSERFWIDFLVDIATLILFAIATWKAFESVMF
jgi:hypothetical protein